MSIANFRHQRHDPEQEFRLFAGGLVRRLILGDDLQSITDASVCCLQYQKTQEGRHHYTVGDLAKLDFSQVTSSRSDEEELRKLPSDLVNTTKNSTKPQEEQLPNNASDR